MIFISLIITLSTGTLLSLESFELSFYYAIYYGLCFLTLRSFKYGNDFFLSFDKERTGYVANKIKLAGQEITSNLEEERQEDRFLNIFETYRIVKRKFFSWILFLGGIWFFFYKNGMELSINSIFPVLSSFFIINSFFVGHLLVAVILNALLVAYNFTPEAALPFYFIYLLSFFVSIYLISKTLEEELTKELLKNKAVALSLITILFIMFFVGFKTILPDEFNLSDTKDELSQQEKTSLQEYLDKSKIDLGQIKSNLTGHNAEGLSPKIDFNLREIEGLEAKLQTQNLSTLQKEKIARDMQSLMENMKNLKLEFHQSLGGEDETQMSPTEKDSFSKLKDDLELTDLEKNNLASFLKKSSDQLSQLKDSPQKEALKNEIDELSQSMQKKEFTAKEQADISEAIEKMTNLQKSIHQDARQEAIKASNIRPEPQQVTKDEILAPLNKKESPRDNSMEKFKRVLAFAGLGLLLFFLHKLLSKKGIDRIEASDPEALKTIQEEWKKIKKLKLSPREEVILYYNLFHESLQKIHYTEHEAPPSCRIYQDMKEINPDLEKPTFIITEVFAQCFYGNKEVNSDSLKIFRKALTKILRVYQFSY